MTEEHGIPQDEGNELEGAGKLDIADLRRLAKILNITAQRDWTKSDYAAAIQKHQADEHTASLAILVGGNAPKPGHSRILIHRDPSPGHKNGPVHVVLNGHIFSIPRGVEVDVPTPFVEVLANARTIVVKQLAGDGRENPTGSYKDEEQMSYPFQIIASTPGEYKNPHDNRHVSYAIRKEFQERNGVWPTTGELAEYRKTRAARV